MADDIPVNIPVEKFNKVITKFRYFYIPHYTFVTLIVLRTKMN